MNKLLEWLRALWEQMPLIVVGAACLCALGIGWLTIASIGILGALLFCVAVGIAVVTYQTTTLLGSVVVGVVLKALLAPISDLTTIWFVGRKEAAFFDFVSHHNYFVIIAMLFFFGYIANLMIRSVCSVLSSIKLVNIVNN